MAQNHYDSRQEDKEAERLFDWLEEQGWFDENCQENSGPLIGQQVQSTSLNQEAPSIHGNSVAVEQSCYIDKWLEEKEEEKKGLAAQRDELVEYLSNIKLNDDLLDPTNEHRKIIQECSKILQKNSCSQNATRKIKRCRRFSDHQRLLLNEARDNYGHSPTREQIEDLSKRSGLTTVTLNRHFRNRRYEESKGISRRRCDSEPAR